MSKNEIKLYYPYRDLKLASNIIRILALKPKTSTKKLGVLLSDIKKSATPPAIKIALERLVETDYVIKKSTTHKSQTDNTWELSCLGNLVSLTILNGYDFDVFVDQYTYEKFYKMIHVLIENSKREFVQLLIDRLNENKNDRLKIENTAIEWYNDMRFKISKMDTTRYPELASLQEKIKFDGFKPINLTKRGFIIDPMFSYTLIDRICY